MSPDTDMLAHYKKLISIRERYSVLRTGSLSTLLVDDTNNIYALLRQDNSSNPTAILIYNNGANQTIVTLNVTNLLPESATFTDVLNDKTYNVDEGKITVPVNGTCASILIATKPSAPSGFPLVYIYAITVGVGIFVTAAIVVRTIRHRRKLAEQRPT